VCWADSAEGGELTGGNGADIDRPASSTAISLFPVDFLLPAPPLRDLDGPGAPPPALAAVSDFDASNGDGGPSWSDAIKTSTACTTPSFTNILEKTSGNFCISISAICNAVNKMDASFDANTPAKKLLKHQSHPHQHKALKGKVMEHKRSS
jgi:hypothetical protein